MNRFIVGKQYSYSDIEEFAEENKLVSLHEWGVELVGQNFIVLSSNDNKAVSFILSHYKQGFFYYYECIHSDFTQYK